MRAVLRVLGKAVAWSLGLMLVAALGLAVALRPPRLEVPEPGFQFDDVTIVTPLGPRLRVASIHGAERIQDISPAADDVGSASRPSGPFVLPGFIDLHVHHPPAIAIGERSLFAMLFLRYGTTTVRDLGAALPALLKRHADVIADGSLAGPRVLHCGPFLDGPPPVWPGASVIETEAEGRAAVDAVAAAGHDCIKLYNELTPRVVAAMVDQAARVGLPVVGHVPWAASLHQMAGVEVQHLMDLPWPLRGGPLDHAIRRYVAVSGQHRISHTPTLVTFARIEQLRRPAHEVQADPIGRLLPRHHRELLWNPTRNPMVAGQMSTPGRIDVMKRAVAALTDAGVPVLAGTDAMNPLVVPGAALLEEIQLLADAGLGAEGALAAATWRAGEALGIPQLGRIEVGAPADLLVFERDPTRDLSNLDSLQGVVAAGRYYPVDVLQTAVDRARDHFEGFPYEPLSMGLADRGLAWLGAFSGGG